MLWPLDANSQLMGNDLMLGKIEGRRRRGRQRMKWLDGFANLMGISLSKLWETVKDRGAWCAVVHGSLRVSPYIGRDVLNLALSDLTWSASTFFYGIPQDGSVVKNLSANSWAAGAVGLIPGLVWEDPLEEETATHSSIIAGSQSTGRKESDVTEPVGTAAKQTRPKRASCRAKWAATATDRLSWKASPFGEKEPGCLFSVSHPCKMLKPPWSISSVKNHFGYVACRSQWKNKNVEPLVKNV